MSDEYCFWAFLAFLVFVAFLAYLWRQVGPKPLSWRQLWRKWKQDRTFVITYLVHALVARGIAKSLIVAVAVGGFGCLGGLCGWDAELFSFGREVLRFLDRHLSKA